VDVGRRMFAGLLGKGRKRVDGRLEKKKKK
jgi:hypothetical protein